MVSVAAVQVPPVYYDLRRGVARAVEVIEQAAVKGIDLLVFPEAWLTGYPLLVWDMLPSNEFGDLSSVYRRMFEHSVDLSRGDLQPIQDAAREQGVVVVMGMNERASEMSAGTVYNAVATIDADGQLLNVHRKVMPTNSERTVWGFGDGRGLNVVDTAVGRVGCLLCWESFMPLARTSLYAQNIEIYCAPTAATNEAWLAAMQHIGREGSCFVIGVASTLEASDIPEDLPPHRPDDPADGWIEPGNGIICGPLGDVLAGPMREEKGFLTAEIDVGQVREARRSFDVVGHYSRPDIFQLSVNRNEMSPVSFGQAD